jgi:hypothetical protein
MVNLTGLWARCSSGTVGSLRFSPRPTYRCFASSRCNNVLYIISVLSLYFWRAHNLIYSICTEKPLRNKNVLKISRRSAFPNPCSMREVRLRLVLCVTICREPLHSLWNPGMYICTNVRVIVSLIAQSQYYVRLSTCERPGNGHLSI